MYIIINYSFIFCLWLNEVYVFDYPYFSISCVLPSPPFFPLHSLVASTGHEPRFQDITIALT